MEIFEIFSTKRTESFKAIQQVLNLPGLKVLHNPETHWLAYERWVKVVKSSCSLIVLTLEHNYEEIHEPEGLDISKTFFKVGVSHGTLVFF